MFACRTLVIVATLAFSLSSVSRAADERFELTVVDKKSGEPIPCRMHLKDARGNVRKIGRLPFWKDHFVFDGKITFELPPGIYTFELERGPEYVFRSGHFEIQKNSDDAQTVELERFVNMAEEGWYSGELHVHRPAKDIELLMRAEDLHVAPVITWWNEKNTWKGKPLPEELLVKFDGSRFYHLMAGEDERGGGALLFFNLKQPLEITAAEREHPSPLKFVEQAKEQGGWVDVEKPFWWDVPTWIASGQVDSIGLANNHLMRSKVYPGEAWGRPRDKSRFPDPWGNGQWSQYIYYQLLNCGLRIPPSAGSASGVLDNPVGYNRVYVYCGEEFSYESWWENFRAGRVMVTNGPLLRPKVLGERPGFVFHGEPGEELEFEIALDLSTRDEVNYLEVVKNGEVVHVVRLQDWIDKKGRLPKLAFNESGWFLVRAVTEVQHTYRFGTTAPYYVEIGGRPRVSKQAAHFFLDWVNERIETLKLDDAEKRAEVLKPHEAAREYWQRLVDQANAE